MGNIDKLGKKIMRRVYYTFALRVATHPMLGHGILLLALVWLLKELVFVARIWESFVATPVGEIGTFVIKLVTNADALTLVVLAAAISIGGLWLKQLVRIRPFTFTDTKPAS